MGVFTTPFIVPLGAFTVAIVAIVAVVVGRVQFRRVKAEQRMAMIARGMSIADIERLIGTKEEEDRPAGLRDPLRSLANARRAGIILVSSGVGIILFLVTVSVVVQERDVLAGAATGLVPLAIGIGFFIDYSLQKRELSRFGLEVEPSAGSSIG
ncbi:DUF6249 domain-containing protein [Granulicella sp. dw_53]|uniref:DUF6249 domain-containing protein n=1 Tax=Granulicella sp. dw_53 TaxID=2719792 RepID=UPI001BD58D1D|nr:DUF6249 domain-containing protein [Granulicella sp. dw_53]